jgi:two-component system, chemotaxis family, protein-glutamate methylesterase/glutaminase
MARDIIVIGGSAGAIEPLRAIVGGLPADLPAALFVVIHTLPTGPGSLGTILDFSGPLTASLASDGEPIRHGHIAVAPPDRHLTIKPGSMHVIYGPEENRHRPAIDPLFRTAASAYGSRVSAVLLSGMLDDGSAGMQHIHRAHGVTIAQSAADALYPEMPGHATDAGIVDHSVPAGQIAALLDRLAREPAASTTRTDPPDDLESPMLERSDNNAEALDNLGALAALSCPNCGGPLWEIDDPAVLRFRCHVGHAYNLDSLTVALSHMQETVLWAALRALEEKAALADRMAAWAETRNPGSFVERYRHRAAEIRSHASELRELIGKWAGDRRLV